MIRSVRRWRPGHLALAWCAYWIALIIIGLGPAIAAAYRLSQHVHGRGDANLSYGDHGFTASITDAGVTTWSGQISFLTLFLLVGVPPLVLWIVWLAVASRTKHAGNTAVARDTEHHLHAAHVDRGVVESSRKRTRAEEV